jgi:hypothetical protein
MDTDQIISLMDQNSIALVISAVALIVAVGTLVYSSSARRNQAYLDAQLKQRTETLWRDMDELRINQFNGTPPPLLGAAGGAPESAQFSAEKAAYDIIWPQLWLLHDRLGMFLRTVESGEPAGELRLEARNAALEAKNALNRHRPYCHEEVDTLVTRVIDTEIKAHLAACQYMDLLKDTATSDTTHDRNIQREKFHLLYDGEARELMNQVVSIIRRRTLRTS